MAALLKSCWTVKVPGKMPFMMVGEPISKHEAQRCARRIWPSAEVY